MKKKSKQPKKFLPSIARKEKKLERELERRRDTVETIRREPVRGATSLTAPRLDKTHRMKHPIDQDDASREAFV